MGLAYEGSHDLSLVFASYAVAVFTSYATLRMASLISMSKEKSVQFSLLAAGSVAIGVGIWAIHLIAMMAYSLPVAISYELTTILGSILPAIFASAVMLYLFTKSEPGNLRLITGAVLIGSGISATYYMKMAAISNTISVAYEPFLLATSLIVAIVLALLALLLNLRPANIEDQRSPRSQWIGPLVLGLAFVAMHYIAMSATYFIPAEAGALTSQFFQSLPLARLVVVCSILLAMLYVAAKSNRLDQQKNQLAAEISNYKKIEASLLEEKESLRLISHEQTDIAQKNEARLESIFDSLADGLIVINKEGIVEDFNPSALRLFGYTKKELSGMNVSTLIPKSRGFEHDGYIESYLKTGRIEIVGTGREVLCYHKNGSTFHAHLSVAEFTAGGNKLFTGIIHDISDRVEAEEELKTAIQKADRASNTKSEFLANMSHEIRTPLNGVMGMLELLRGTSLDTRQDNYIKTAYSSANSLLSIISSILDFSQMESGTLSIQNMPFDIRKVIEDSVEQVAADIAEKGLEFNCLIADDVPRTLTGDEAHLEQIILNLVSNSVKFTDSGKISIKVFLAAMDGSKAQIFFEIEDTGIGIAEHKLDDLFNAFTQEDNSPTRKYGGSGLGLAVTKRLVDLMEGEINVNSEEGKGTTFAFSLWFELPEFEEEAVTTAFRNDLRVLVVDDNKTNRDILSYYLTCWNISSSSAQDGKTALAILKKAVANGAPYHVAIIDYLMPGMDGIELTQAIKSDERMANTEIIMLSSADDSDDAIEQAGIKFSFPKPVRQLKLYDCLKSIAAETSQTASVEEDGYSERQNRVRLASKNVLIVDDMPTNLRVGKEMMRKLGVEADLATNGGEAIEALSTKQYDLVLMDCQMPVMDGYMATREIRALEKAAGRKQHLPIVAVTAHALEGDREASLAAGMDDHLTKPIAFSELETLIVRWLL